MKFLPVIAAAILMLCLSTSNAGDIDIKVVGLFTNKVLLEIEGEQKLLSKGETFNGVTLISASARGAVVSIHGEKKKLSLNQSIGSNYKKPDRAKSTIYPDEQGMYYVKGKINGRSLRFLIDTGATYLTMSGQQAALIGIDYRQGVRGFVNTASSTVPVWQIVLDRVSVGDISVPNVEASVIEGSRPHDALLGNSFLKFTQLERTGSVMELRKRY
ncbi:MAG: retropepsin-like aspartic protease [Gammaproteobacteria bacterium]